MVLTLEGFDVVTAADGEEALSLMEEEIPKVVVLDLQMPRMDGRTLFNIMLNWPERPPVILCSAYLVEESRQQLGAEASLAKPFDTDDLVDLVKAYGALPA